MSAKLNHSTKDKHKNGNIKALQNKDTNQTPLKLDFSRSNGHPASERYKTTPSYEAKARSPAITSRNLKGKVLKVDLCRRTLTSIKSPSLKSRKNPSRSFGTSLSKKKPISATPKVKSPKKWRHSLKAIYSEPKSFDKAHDPAENIKPMKNLDKIKPSQRVLNPGSRLKYTPVYLKARNRSENESPIMAPAYQSHFSRHKKMPETPNSPKQTYAKNMSKRKRKVPCVVVMDLSSDMYTTKKDGKINKLRTIVEKRETPLTDFRNVKEKLVKTESALDTINSNNEEKSITLEEVKYLQIKIRQVLRVFGMNLNETMLVNPEYTCLEFADKLSGLSTISSSEAENLALYFFGCDNIGSKTTKLSKETILERIKEFAGPISDLNLNIFEEIQMNLEFNAENNAGSNLVEYLKSLSECEMITPLDIFSINPNIEAEIDQMSICKYLLNKSLSMTEIKSSILKSFIEELEEHLKVENLSPGNGLDMKFVKSSSTRVRGKMYTDFGPTPDQIVEKGQHMFLMLADFLFDNNSTLLKIIHPMIFNKTMDGKEYQLIKLDHFYDALEEQGFVINPQDRFCIEHLIKPVFRDIVSVDDIRFFLSNLGIEEKLPQSTAHLDYTHLIGPSIRIFNGIIKYMENHKVGDKPSPITDIIEVLGEDNIEHYSVVSKDKEHKIQVISTQNFREVLRDIGVIPFGEDMSDNLTEFLAINDEFDDLLMINKLKRSLKDIKNSAYFQYYGTSRRSEEDVINSLSNPGLLKMGRSQTWKLSKQLPNRVDSLKSSIEEKPSKKRKDSNIEETLTMSKFYYKKQESDSESSREVLRPEYNESEKNSFHSDSSFKSVDLSELDGEGDQKRVMMRKKFGLMPSFKKFKMKPKD